MSDNTTAEETEPKPATVIVVTETPIVSGRLPVERRFDADSYRLGNHGDLGIQRTARKDDPVIATYAASAWLAVREDGAVIPDPPDGTARALEVARRALLEILRRSEDGGEQPFGRPEIGTIAHTALEGIWTETEG